jgi:hypothetical protein
VVFFFSCEHGLIFGTSLSFLFLWNFY